MAARHRITWFTRRGLRFPVIDRGPVDAPPVVLLHGFPERAASWTPVSDQLVGAGFRTIAFDQRGYASTARPRQVRRYRVAELVGDVVALADHAQLPTFDLVGHDWGGAVAWSLADARPERLRRLAILSTPHPRALVASVLRSDQLLRSSYAGFFQLPVVAETVLTAHGGVVLASALRGSGLGEEQVRDSVATMSRPGALRAALNWYRAAARWPFGSPGTIAVPTLYLWSTGDGALGRTAAEGTARWVSGDYRFEVLDGVSHWMHHEQPELVGAAIASWFAAGRTGS